MCLVRQCKIGYVALEGLTGVQRSCHVRQCKIGSADWSLKDLSCKTM